MLAKLLQYVAKFLLLPLLKELLDIVIDWVKSRKKNNDREKENQQKAKEFEGATGSKEREDTFRNLP